MFFIPFFEIKIKSEIIIKNKSYEENASILGSSVITEASTKRKIKAKKVARWPLKANVCEYFRFALTVSLITSKKRI